MMDLQEISDRLEIQDLFARYSFAIDERDWDALDTIFTPDAQIDYTETGGAKGSWAQIQAWRRVCGRTRRGSNPTAAHGAAHQADADGRRGDEPDDPVQPDGSPQRGGW